LLTSCSTPRRIRTFAGGGHSLDFIKAFECLDLVGWEQAGDVPPRNRPLGVNR
jgi:hypothetical protein